MNKTKSIVTGFAIFAAFLMLMATCIAGPVREKTSLDAVENEQEELLDSLEALFLNIESNEDLSDLQSYLENNYAEDIQNINNEFIQLLETLLENQNTDTDSEDLVIAGFLPFDGVIPVGLPDGDLGLIEGQQDLTISSSGDIVLMSEELELINNNGGDSPENLDSGEAQYAGFAFNIDGGMLVPGFGWVYPDDPNWGDWYDLHNSLQGMPMSSATAVLELFAEMLGPGTTGIISTLILIFMAIFELIVTAIAMWVDDIFSSILYICGLIVGAIAAFVTAFMAGLDWFLNTVQDILDGILAWLRGLLPP